MMMTGSTASHKVNARNACTNPLPTTMRIAVSGVKKSKPSVPSRFSRAMQSALMAGTITQISASNISCKPVKSRSPSVA
jgi:hypothetical protein